jgi:type II secretory ATPase GspE/PulE/Tfp pilus assembly ATPase PilB-like protein
VFVDKNYFDRKLQLGYNYSIQLKQKIQKYNIKNMPIELDVTRLGKKTPPKVQNLNSNQLHKMARVIGDLDQKYTEMNTKDEAKAKGLDYIDLYGFPIETSHLGLLTQKEVEYYRMGVFSMKDKSLFLATDTPDYAPQKELLKKLDDKMYKYKIYFCSRLSMDKLIRTYDHIVLQKVISDEIDIDMSKMSLYNDTYITFQDNVRTYSTSEIVERILKLAIDSKASDIHFEPEKDYYHIRLRLDGVLQNLAKIPKEAQKAIESRLKILSKLKLNISQATQDGRFSFKINSREIDVRVSMLPSNYGYSIVMRLLGTDSVILQLDQLGFIGRNKDIVMRAIAKPQGLILTTGPTGSGKTTTLYTFLQTLNDGENKIITLEDPIEYKLEGVSQTQINDDSGYTFGAGLRSILRQDPDIVMVGEIRDLETAQTAVQASFTGHQVLSTIHTNDATGAIPRLMQMGLQGYLIADSLQVAIGQRLVRRLCNYCKVKQALNAGEQKMVIEELSSLSREDKANLPKKLEFYTCTGCTKCNKLGYKGRVGCYEVLEMNDSIRVLLSNQNLSLVEIRNTAKATGMITMFQDGLLKCLNGETDIVELMRNVNR